MDREELAERILFLTEKRRRRKKMEKVNKDKIEEMLKIALEQKTSYAVLGIITLLREVIINDFKKNQIVWWKK